ncbi:MAG: ABC transporter substrate-binding protein [Rhodospirillales bacterium]|nr:ABC transporter substrate-binding protein [Rhodospirillales bacterium]
MTKRLAALAAFALLLAARAQAADVTMGIRTDPNSIDPHYHVYTPNSAVARHIFDALTRTNAKGQIEPALATSWKPVGDTEWIFTLRQGVTFHDGTPFTAADVVFTLQRAPHVPNSPSSYSQYTKAITGAEVVDDHTVRILTRAPSPTLPIDLAQVAVISKRAAEGKSTTDFNNGTAAIGTGPYRFVEWVPGNRVVFARNPTYWGGPEPWERVTRRPIPNDGARVAAMLSGDVDMIEGVPGVDRARLSGTPNVVLYECDSFRIIYIHMDSARDVSPGISDANGQKMDRNPLRDTRVRQAISLAINRQALVERLLSGQAHAAGQYTPPGLPGASANLPPPAYDPAAAQKLLKEAGWGEGFSVVLAGSNDRFPNDAQVTQAVGQMLARVGIKTEVQTMPATMLFTRGSKLEFSMMLSGWVGTGDPSSPLTALMATWDPKTGMGPSNRGRWSNPDFDATLGKALRTFDDAERNALYAKASEIAVHQAGVIPVYFTINTWATKKGLVYDARLDELSLAMGLKPQAVGN